MYIFIHKRTDQKGPKRLAKAKRITKFATRTYSLYIRLEREFGGGRIKSAILCAIWHLYGHHTHGATRLLVRVSLLGNDDKAKRRAPLCASGNLQGYLRVECGVFARRWLKARERFAEHCRDSVFSPVVLTLFLWLISRSSRELTISAFEIEIDWGEWFA